MLLNQTRRARRKCVACREVTLFALWRDGDYNRKKRQHVTRSGSREERRVVRQTPVPFRQVGRILFRAETDSSNYESTFEPYINELFVPHAQISSDFRVILVPNEHLNPAPFQSRLTG